MNLLELIHSAVLSLRTHKLRVFLTMIGIIIGISSVVVILSVGEGLKAQVNQSTEDTGANAITVNFEPYDLKWLKRATEEEKVEEASFSKEACAAF